MIKITSIKDSSNNKYELIIDNKKHIILGDVLLELKILKPCEIDIDTYNKIVSRNNFYEAYNKILKFITFKLRTEKEIKDKLYKLGVNKKDQDTIIQRLKDEHFLNDEKYIKCYITDQINLTLNGPKKILYDLKRLNFSDELINKYLNNINNDIWEGKIQKIILKKQKANHTLSINKFINKLKQDLNNLGYSESLYNKYIDHIDFDDQKQMLKDYKKIYQKYSSKYSDDKLELIIKQKLYSLGYDLNSYEQIKTETN